ncbi:hypothetical protein MILLY_26 [Mycobacterium phage Milly]|uniref:hypothetical protein n=1 Tax=Mycobacterium phage Milly TaxID=1567473 RepID=UPI000572AB0C|nr:hypothetical protein MILLY_26 [Mycobacterium phage Milly]AJA43699.1 hypothetical protein MILLY_26 [Mycobacterium phage Milly]
MNADDYTFGIRYEWLPDPDADPDDPANWREWVVPAATLAEAEGWLGAVAPAQADNPYVRGFGIVYSPKITWRPWPPGGD